MKNFKITPAGPKFKISPLSDIGAILATHCLNRWDKLVYPTYAIAESAAYGMEQAIEDNPDRSWMLFKP